METTRKKSKMRKAYEAAEEAVLEASGKIQKLEGLVHYSGFPPDNEPQIMIATGNEIIMVWNGRELFPDDFICLMEETGRIIPDDFGMV